MPMRREAGDSCLEKPFMRAISRIWMFVIALFPIFSGTSEAAPPVGKTGFDPRIITFGDSRKEIKNTPIEKRAYRPLHIYGNSVRRRYYRGSSPSRPTTNRRR